MALIAIEGIDASGKTTLCVELKNLYMKHLGRKLTVHQFPDRKKLPYGPTINAYLQGKIHLAPEHVH